VRSLDSLADRIQFKLRFLGEAADGNPYAQEFLQLIKTRPWCQYVGFVARAGLDAALSAASLLVLPSLEDNCPMAVLEAMAAGVPVAASRIGGIPDLIADEINGLLFEPTDQNQICAAIERLLRDAKFANAVAEKARVKTSEQFRPSAIARKHLEIYGV